MHLNLALQIVARRPKDLGLPTSDFVDLAMRKLTGALTTRATHLQNRSFIYHDAYAKAWWTDPSPNWSEDKRAVLEDELATATWSV